MPLLEDVVGWSGPAQIRAFFEACGLEVQEWDKMQIDLVSIRETPGGVSAGEAVAARARDHDG